MHELENCVGNTCCPCGRGQVPDRRAKGGGEGKVLGAWFPYSCAWISEDS